MPITQRITPFLWFADQAEEAARFYAAIFPNSSVGAISRYTAAGQEHHGRPVGSVMTVSFVLDGVQFTALNGGPIFKFTEAISLQINCDGQNEIDYYWEKLSAGGDPQAQQCGWLKDKFGLSWQVVPQQMFTILQSPGGPRALQALMDMKKLDLAALERAAAG